MMQGRRSRIPATDATPTQDDLILTRDLMRVFAETVELQDAFQAALERICVAGHWALGQVWMPDPGGHLITCGSAWFGTDPDLAPFREVSLASGMRRGVGLPGRAWASGVPAWITDVTRDPNFPRAPVASACGLSAGMAVPVLAGDEVVAILEFFVREARAEDRRLIDLVSTIAGQLGALVRRSQIEEALRTSEERFRAVAESAHDAIITADRSGAITFFNRGAEAMFGMESAEALGKQLTVLMPERFHDSHRAGMHRFLETGVPRVIGGTVELAAVRADGTEFPIELSLATWSAGGETSFTGIIRDITERKRAEEAQSLFLATASHELRTPLTIMQGFAELLVSGRIVDEEARQEAAETIVRRAKDLARIVDRLLLSSRIESGRLGLSLEPIDLGPWLVERIRETAAATGRTVESTVAPDLPRVAGDASAISTILDHLLENAIKYSPAGEPVRLTAREHAGAVEFSVTDAGIGMTPDQVEHCFDRFWQAQSGNDRAFGGTGIGLYIVRSLVEVIGGTVDVRSAPGQGTTFVVRLAPFREPAVHRTAPA